MTGLQIRAITVNYGGDPALQQFSLDVAEGEVIAVLGPSGSGKSTLLRAIAGLEPLVGGSIILGGRDLAGVPTHRRGLGLMFQDHGLFSHLDVAGNIGYGLRTAGASKELQRNRVTELLKLVELEGFEQRSPDQLSGGEAQRVALARALAPEPRLLMLDEPLGSLDRALRDQLTGDLRRMLTDIGQTALHVTHDQSEAFAIADRVAVIADGRLVAVGSPAQLWSDPGTVFIAEFLGHPNIWTVSVDGDGDVHWGRNRLGWLGLDNPLRADGPGERTVVVPTTAIQPIVGDHGPGGRQDPITVSVTSAVFQQGLYDVIAVPLNQRAQDRAIRFTTPHPVADAAQLMVTVNLELVRALSTS